MVMIGSTELNKIRFFDQISSVSWVFGLPSTIRWQGEAQTFKQFQLEQLIKDG